MTTSGHIDRRARNAAWHRTLMDASRAAHADTLAARIAVDVRDYRLALINAEAAADAAVRLVRALHHRAASDR